MSARTIKQAEIILNRVINQIQIIKKGLSSIGSIHFYNDFLIIAQIVPKLPSRVLPEVLLELRAMNDSLNKTHKQPSINTRHLLVILAKAREEAADHLLNDFLSSSY